jgi:ligand-binding sensor domain-containing protein
VPSLHYVRDLLLDTSGRLWVAHANGADLLERGRWRHFSPADGLPARALWSLAQDASGTVFLGGEPGLLRFDGARFHLVASPEQLGLEAVEFLYRDPAGGALWLACASPRQGGVLRYDGRSFEAWTHRPGLAHPAVAAILRDRSGALWFATGFGRLGGASCLRDGAWSTLTRPSGLAGEKARSLFEDSDGRMWIGSEYDGVVAFRGSARRLFTPNQGLSGWEVKEMVEQSGVLWLATEAGLTRIEGLR